MEKEFVTYELALRMKTLGFDEPCFGYYTNQSYLVIDEIASQQGNNEVTSAPTWQSAFRWFREKYGLYFNIHRLEHKIGTKEEFMLTIDAPLRGGYYKNYEEAEMDCLFKLIEFVEKELIN